MLNAAAHFDYQVPEVFAGLRRSETHVPDRLPDCGSAAGVGRRHACAAPSALARAPAGHQAPLAGDGRAAGAADVGGRACGSPACARSIDVGRASRRRSSASRGGLVERLRVAVLAPPWFAVPRPATAGSSGSSRCSRTGSSTRATTSRCSRPATRRRAPSSHAVFETAPSELIGRTFWELQHVHLLLRAIDQFDVINDHSGLRRRRSAARCRRRACTPCTDR